MIASPCFVRGNRGKSLLAISLLVVCLFYAGVWGFEIRARRPWGGTLVGLIGAYGETVRFNPLAATALFAGFRGFAADLLWLKADSSWHHGQWHRLLPLYYLIVALQPRFTIVWSVGAWHMAYNLSEKARTNPEYPPAAREVEARQWVDEGILFLQEGLKYNQDKPDLYFDLGWTHFDKTKDFAAAVSNLEKAAHMSDSVLVWKALAHAYEKSGRDRDALRVWEFLGQRGDTVAQRFVERLKQKVVGESQRGGV